MGKGANIKRRGGQLANQIPIDDSCGRMVSFNNIFKKSCGKTKRMNSFKEFNYSVWGIMLLVLVVEFKEFILGLACYYLRGLCFAATYNSKHHAERYSEISVPKACCDELHLGTSWHPKAGFYWETQVSIKLSVDFDFYVAVEVYELKL